MRKDQPKLHITNPGKMIPPHSLRHTGVNTPEGLTLLIVLKAVRKTVYAILLKPFGRNELMGAVSRTLGEDAA